MMKCPTCGARYSSSERLCPKDGAVLEAEQSREQQFIGTTLDGKYRLDSFISRGGMGAVFRGTHVMLNRPVAVKMIKADLVTSPEVVRRFQREARAATQLNHPNIVNVYDLGQTSDGTLYIAMELVPGESLKHAIKAHGPFDGARIVRVLAQVCDGLAVAHRAGIVHRDLKPQNVMLTEDRNGNEMAKIVDFGIAKTFEIDAHTQLTVEGATLGTPQYMSPEQAAGTDIDARSDIYSLGVILYEMLTGEVPFHAESVPAVLVKHMSEPPTAPSLRRPDLSISQELEAIALRCLAKYPAERYATADELAQALRAAVPLPPDIATMRVAGAAAMGATMPSARGTQLPPVPGADGAATGGATPATRPTAPGVLPPPLPPASAQAAVGRGSRAPIAVLVGGLLLLLTATVGVAYWGWSRMFAPPEATIAIDPAAAPVTSPAAADPAPPAAPTTSSQGQAAAVPPPPPAPAEVPSSAGAQTRASEQAARDPRATTPPAASAAATRNAGGPPAAGGGTRARASSGQDTTAAGTRGAADTRAAAAAGAQTPSQALPESPTVSFQCRGAGEICTPLRSAMAEAFEREGLSLQRSGGDIVLTAEVTTVDDRVDRSFGTTMAVRTYSIEVEGESPRLDRDVPMPVSRTVSADPRLGGERFAEAARLVAAGAAERVKTFWKAQRP